MKNLKVVFFALLLASMSAYANEVKEESACLPVMAKKVDVATGQVLCCCNTYNGMCCKYVSGFCGSYVPGCLCSAKALEYPD